MLEGGDNEVFQKIPPSSSFWTVGCRPSWLGGTNIRHPPRAQVEGTSWEYWRALPYSALLYTLFLKSVNLMVTQARWSPHLAKGLSPLLENWTLANSTSSANTACKDQQASACHQRCHGDCRVPLKCCSTGPLFPFCSRDLIHSFNVFGVQQ